MNEGLHLVQISHSIVPQVAIPQKRQIKHHHHHSYRTLKANLKKWVFNCFLVCTVRDAASAGREFQTIRNNKQLLLVCKTRLPVYRVGQKRFLNDFSTNCTKMFANRACFCHIQMICTAQGYNTLLINILLAKYVMQRNEAIEDSRLHHHAQLKTWKHKTDRQTEIRHYCTHRHTDTNTSNS